MSKTVKFAVNTGVVMNFMRAKISGTPEPSSPRAQTEILRRIGAVIRGNILAIQLQTKISNIII